MQLKSSTLAATRSDTTHSPTSTDKSIKVSVRVDFQTKRKVKSDNWEIQSIILDRRRSFRLAGRAVTYPSSAKPKTRTLTM